MHTVTHKFQVSDRVYLVEPLRTVCPTCNSLTLFCKWVTIGPCCVLSVTISPTPYGAYSPIYVLAGPPKVYPNVLEINCFTTREEAEAEAQRRNESKKKERADEEQT